MKRIELKSIYMKNFKGIRDLKITCGPETNIYGDNATGKTTFKDAVKWLLFGKDSADRTDSGKGSFTLKTLDQTGRAIPGLEHTVSGELYINNKLKTLKRTFREKWTKKRGEADAVFTGHETKFWVDDIPVTAGEYHEEVSGIIEETLFKLITDPVYFSSYMHWQDRRKILDDMIDEITVDEVIAGDEKLFALKELLDDGGIDKLRKKIAAQKKNFNDELKAIPVRIDECNNSFVEARSRDRLNTELDELVTELDVIDGFLTDISREDPVLAQKKEELIELRRKISMIESGMQKDRFDRGYKLEGKLQQLEKEKDNKEESLALVKQQAARLAVQSEDLKADIGRYRKEYDAKNAEEFKLDDDLVCPTCGRELTPQAASEKKDEMISNFNKAKSAALEGIGELGKNAALRKNRIDEQLSRLEDEQSKLSQEIYEFTKNIKNTEREIEDFENTDTEYPDEYYELRVEASQLADKVEAPENVQKKINELKERKKELNSAIDDIKWELNNVESNKKLDERITNLNIRERELSKQIAALEQQEFLCERFIRAKVELLDEKINSMFTFVRFKLFDEQINGGLTETCEAMIDGVPFTDANNAARINAGIDIINTLSRYYKISAPIIIDNRESINKITNTDAQIINLIVSKDKKLKVA